MTHEEQIEKLQGEIAELRKQLAEEHIADVQINDIVSQYIARAEQAESALASAQKELEATKALYSQYRSDAREQFAELNEEFESKGSRIAELEWAVKSAIERIKGREYTMDLTMIASNTLPDSMRRKILPDPPAVPGPPQEKQEGSDA